MQGIAGIGGQEVLELVYSGEVLLIIDSIDEKTVGFTPERALHFWQQIRRCVTSVRDEQGMKITSSKDLKKVVLPDSLSLTDSSRPSSRFSGKVILACRTHYFRDLEDVDSQLSGARKAGFRREDFQFTFLNDFTQAQILAYLKVCFDDRAEELWDTLKGIYNIPDLAKR